MARAPRTPASTARAAKPAGAPHDGGASASDELLELFAVIGGAEVRRMFGGRGVFRDGLMFALQARGELFLKVDPAFAERMAGLGSSPFHYVSSTREVTLPYWRLPDEALDDDDLRRDLLRQALAVAHAAAARKAPKSSGRAPKTTAKATSAKATPAETDARSTPPDFDALGLAEPASAPDAAPARARRAPKAASVPPRRPPRT